MKMALALLVLLGAAAGCSKVNPSASCTDGTCTNPAFPVCDVDGTLAGKKGTCVAFSCTPGSLSLCQDASTALVCDAAGDNLEAMACTGGCDPSVGCRTCTPNETTCTGSTLQTCSAAGAVASTEACSLGCNTASARCNALEPSNGLGVYLDMTPSPQDLTLTAGTLDLKDGTLTVGGVVSTIPSFDVPAPSQGSPIRVFVGKHVVLGDLTVVDTTDATGGVTSTGSRGGIGRAFAVLATGDIDVTGRLSVMTGAIEIVGCTGVEGSSFSNGSFTAQGGDSGGGHATPGAHGGTVPPMELGAPAGTASGNDELVPLRGGCPSATSATFGAANYGGGAIQLDSPTAVNISGSIVADGQGATHNEEGSFRENLGGGGGGGILIETPQLTISASGKLLARGGGGTLSGTDAPTPPDDASAPQGTSGALCESQGFECGGGGAGATNGTLAQPGSDTPNSTNPTKNDYEGGGGGGGLGRIRLNTADGTFVSSSSSVLAGSLTTSTASSK